MKLKVFIATTIIILLSACSKTSVEFQKDADIYRLKHLSYYVALIESYKEKTGTYPLQGQYEVPVYVYVANDKQIEYTKDGPPYKHEVVAFKDLVLELESKLGREVDEFFDPQYRPDSKPNYYVYMTTKDAYFFAVHVHQDFPFARKVADNYYKVEVSNRENDRNKTKLPGQLFASEEYEKEVSKKVSKEGFFKEREDKYIRHSKN